MGTITLKTTAASGGHAFAVDDSRSGGVRADLPLGPSGDGHALFYRVTGVPLAEVMRRFNGAALRRVWEVPVRSARPRRRVTAGAFRAGPGCRRTGARRQPPASPTPAGRRERLARR